MRDKKTLNIEYKNNKVIITFPVKTWTKIFYAIAFVAFLYSAFHYTSSTFSLAAFVVIFSVIWIRFIMSFFRKLIIDKDTNTIIYHSLIKHSFKSNEIISFESIIEEEVEASEERYFLLIMLNNKTIKIETQSNEQSLILRDEIMSFYH